MEIRFANDRTTFDFSLRRYLAQRFPPLLKRPVQSVDQVGTWNKDLGELPVGDGNFMNTLDPGLPLGSGGKPITNPPVYDISESATIKDALDCLDDWIVASLKKQMPSAAVKALSDWLAGEWHRYWPESSQWTAWEDYFWEYVKIQGHHGLQIGTDKAVVVSPLVGHVEIHPGWGKWHEDSIEVDWRYAENYELDIEKRGKPIRVSDTRHRPASVCDPLGTAFSWQLPQYGPGGQPLKNEHGDCVHRWHRLDQSWQWPNWDLDGSVIVDEENNPTCVDHEGYDLYLFVCYRGPSLTSAYFHNQQGAKEKVNSSLLATLHPRDHWAVREAEVEASRAVFTIYESIPTALRIALDSRFPQVSWSLNRVAREVADYQVPLRDPMWLNPDVHKATLEEADRLARPEQLEGRGKRQLRNLGRQIFVSDLNADSPATSHIREVRRRTDQVEPAADALTSIPLESWQEGFLLPSEMSTIASKLRSSRQRSMLDRHVEIVELVERAFRQFRRGEGRRMDFDPAFCHWVGTIDGRAIKERPKNRPKGWPIYTHEWSTPIHENLFRVDRDSPDAGERFLSPNLAKSPNDFPAPGDFEPLAERIIGVLRQAQCSHVVSEVQGLGISLLKFLQLPEKHRGRSEWTELLFSLCDSGDEGFASLILAEKLVVHVRNFLAHGVAHESQPELADSVVCVNYESRIGLLLDGQSLEHCFRLVLAILAAIVHYSSERATSETDLILQTIRSAS